MSIITAYNEAWKNGDKEALDALVHEDFVFNPHVGGHTMGKSDIMQFAGSGHVTSENDRILFENEEVGVAHSIVHFANDSDSEAVLSFMRFKDGQIISMETGAHLCRTTTSLLDKIEFSKCRNLRRSFDRVCLPRPFG